MAIKHQFVSAIPDGDDDTLVRPGDWNANHVIEDDSITYAKLQNVSATDKVLGRSSSGSGDVEEITCTAAGRALIDDATAADQRTTLGLGTAATQNTGAFDAAGLAAAAYASAASDLTAHAAVTTTHGISSFGASLVDDANAAAARTTLGLASIAASGSASDLSAGTVPAARMPALTGDVTTVAGAVATTIANDAVTTAKVLAKNITYAKIQDISGTDKLLGRSSAGSGVTEEIACTAAGRALIDDATSDDQLVTLGLGTGVWGTGIDGSLHFDGTTTITGVVTGVGALSLVPVASVYTLTRDIYATDITIDNGVEVRTAGYRVFVTGTLTNNGTLGEKGNNGANGTAGVTGAGGAGGTAPWTLNTRPCHPGMAGGAGSTAAVGTSGGGGTGNTPTASPLGAPTGGTLAGANGAAFNGGGGGANSDAQAGGSVGALTGSAITAVSNESWPIAITGVQFQATTTNMGCGSSGGGGRGASNSHGGGGGGGGASSPDVVIVARFIAGNGTIRAKGGTGGNGVTNSGGGAGGAGGGLKILTTTRSGALTNSTDVTGGSGGTNGGGGGVAGGNGGAGKLYYFNP